MRDLARRAALATLWSISGHVATAALSIVATLVLVHALTPAQFGDYALAAALVTVFSVVVGFGLDSIVIREIARAPERTSEFVSTAIVLRLLLAIPAFLAAVISAYALGYDPDVRLLTIVGAIMYVGGSISMLQTILAVKLRFDNVFLVNVLPQGLVTLAIVGLVWLKAPLVSFVAAEVTVRLAGLLILVPASREYVALRFRWNKVLAAQMMRDGIALFMVALSGVAITKLHLLILAKLAAPATVGYFAAASRIVDVITAAGSALFVSALPLLAHYSRGDKATYMRVTRQAFRYLYFGAIPMCALVTVLAPLLLGIVLGEGMAPAAPMLQVFVWVQLFWFSSLLITSILLVERMPWHILTMNVASGGLNLVLALFLVPLFGGIGAAVAGVVSAAFALLCALAWERTRVMASSMFQALALGALAALGGVGVFLLTRFAGAIALVSIPSAFVAYFAVALLVGLFTRDDVAIWVDAMRRKRASGTSVDHLEEVMQ